MTSRQRAMVAGVAVAGVAALMTLFLSPWRDGPRRSFERLVSRLGVSAPAEAPARTRTPLERIPPLPATGWHHGGPLNADSLAGSVVVLAVFSDTHPVTLEALPRLEQWHEAYARFGVRVIGVHAPEYAFATAPAIVARLSDRLGLSFPIVEDPALSVLGTFGGSGNDVQLALAGADGRVRAITVAGDPARDMPALEQTLRALLREAHPDLGFPPGAAADPPDHGAPSRVRTIRLGSSSVREGPLLGARPGRPQPFTAQFRFEVEGAPWVPYPIGWWTPGSEGIKAVQGGAAQFLAIRYDAPRVGVVASPPESGPTRLWILRDEAWLPADALGADARLDARGASYVDVDEPRLYIVTRGSGEHVLKVSPAAAGLTLHALTFAPDADVPSP